MLAWRKRKHWGLHGETDMMATDLMERDMMETDMMVTDMIEARRVLWQALQQQQALQLQAPRSLW
jgi:hypothetical protein